MHRLTMPVGNFLCIVVVMLITTLFVLFGIFIESNTITEETEQESPILYASYTQNQIDTINMATAYVRMSKLSEQRIREKLQEGYPNYPQEDIDFAIDYINNNIIVDWNKRALDDAFYILESKSCDKQELYNILTKDEKYTTDQASYALSNINREEF